MPSNLRHPERGDEMEGRPRRGGDWRREAVPAVMGLARACERSRLIYHGGPLPVFSSLLIPLTCRLIIVPNRQKRRGWLANYGREVDIV